MHQGQTHTSRRGLKLGPTSCIAPQGQPRTPGHPPKSDDYPACRRLAALPEIDHSALNQSQGEMRRRWETSDEDESFSRYG